MYNIDVPNQALNIGDPDKMVYRFMYNTDGQEYYIYGVDRHYTSEQSIYSCVCDLTTSGFCEINTTPNLLANQVFGTIAEMLENIFSKYNEIETFKDKTIKYI